MVYAVSLWNYIKEILVTMIIKHDTPSSFKHDFDFISDNNHTVTMFSTTVDTIQYLIGP